MSAAITAVKIAPINFLKYKRNKNMNDDQVDKIIKELRDIRGIMSKAYQLFWVASLLLLLILVVNFV